MKYRETAELASFQGIWKGGFFDGDPLDPMGSNSYGSIGYMSVLHATYLKCIKPFVKSDTVVLEIGPGRGAFTKCFVAAEARKIYCLDALSAEHNGFWDYVGRSDRIEYHQVKDFSLSAVPEDAIDYFFSFGCLCHISPALVRTYIENLFPKMKEGARGFLMISDYEKYNETVERVDRYSIGRGFVGRRLLPMRIAWQFAYSLFVPHAINKPLSRNEDDIPSPGRWYHLGLDNACSMLEAAGFDIIERDVGTVFRDPIVHFRRC